MARQGVHRYSYSGADVKAIAYFNQRDQTKVHLESLHTLSLSVFEAKGRVRTLGFKSVRGFTRAVREIAGTMIMLVIEDHPFADLMKLNKITRRDTNLYGMDSRSSWSLDAKSTVHGAKALKFGGSYAGKWASDNAIYRRAPTTLPPFNLVLYYNTEVPNQNIWAPRKPTVADGVAAVEILDIEIIGEGIVTSVNDMVTEIQYQFLARDFREFALDRDYQFQKSKKFQDMQLELEKLKKEKKLNAKSGVSVDETGTVTAMAGGNEPTSGFAKKMAMRMLKDLGSVYVPDNVVENLLPQGVAPPASEEKLNETPVAATSETTDGYKTREEATISKMSASIKSDLNTQEQADLLSELDKWKAGTVPTEEQPKGGWPEDSYYEGEAVTNAIFSKLPESAKVLYDQDGNVVAETPLLGLHVNHGNSDLLFEYGDPNSYDADSQYYKSTIIQVISLKDFEDALN